MPRDARVIALTVVLGAAAAWPAAGEDFGWQAPFDGKTLDGWQTAGGAWKAEEGALVGASDGAPAQCLTRDSFPDVEIYVDFKVERSAEAALVLRAGKNGKAAGEVLLGNREGVPVGAVAVNGQRVAVPEKKAQEGFRPDDWNRLYVRIAGKPSKVTVVLNEWRILNAVDAPGLPADDGPIGLRLQGGGGKSARIRGLRVRSVARPVYEGSPPPGEIPPDIPENQADVAHLMAKVYNLVDPTGQPPPSPDGVVRARVGSRIRLDCTPKDGQRKHTRAQGVPMWTLSDPSLVEVSGRSPYNPLLKALKPGALTIHAEVDGIRSRPIEVKLVE